jgi:hypothetical protein
VKTKPVIGSPYQLVYRVDVLVLAMFAASLLDVLTTWLFLSRSLGFEAFTE